MRKLKERVILALDLATDKQALGFVKRLYPRVKIFKVGPVLFTAYGPKVVEAVRKKGGEVFLDLKFHDIPNTVAGAVRQATGLKVKMLTLHTAGGEEMLARAAQAAREEAAKLRIKKPLLLGITVLTSEKEGANTRKSVLERALLAQRSGLDGVVCSVRETEAVRKACGENFIIVTPGIRPKGVDLGDQKRVATAREAFAAGADYIVVGRPVLEAPEPLKAVEALF